MAKRKVKITVQKISGGLWVELYGDDADEVAAEIQALERRPELRAAGDFMEEAFALGVETAKAGGPVAVISAAYLRGVDSVLGQGDLSSPSLWELHDRISRRLRHGNWC